MRVTDQTASVFQKKFTVLEDHVVIASCFATNFFGTEQVIHLHTSQVYHTHRSKGIGSKFHKERLDHFEEEGCTDLLTCIVNTANEPQMKILKKHGWKFVYKFMSNEQELCFCVYDVPKPIPYDPNQQMVEDDDL
jgi:GNAT superfamily N-acetyltransferase